MNFEIPEVKIPEPPKFSDILEFLEKLNIELPERLDEADPVFLIARIQKARDFVSQILSRAKYLRGKLQTVYDIGRDEIIAKDDSDCPVAVKERKADLMLSEVKKRLKNYSALIEGLNELINNLDAKFNACSRQIAVLELEGRKTK